MARTQTKTRKKQNAREVQRVIEYLEGCPDLCAEGRERLAWWKRHGPRYRTVRAALETWTPAQILSWLDFINADYDAGDILDPVDLGSQIVGNRWPFQAMTRAQPMLDAFRDTDNKKRRTDKGRRAIILASAERVLPE